MFSPTLGEVASVTSVTLPLHFRYMTDMWATKNGRCTKPPEITPRGTGCFRHESSSSVCTRTRTRSRLTQSTPPQRYRGGMYCVTQQLAHTVPHALFAHQHMRERAERAEKKSRQKSVHAGHVAASRAIRGSPAAPPPHARPREPHSARGAPPASDTQQHAKVSRQGRVSALLRVGGVAVPPALPAAPPAPQQHEQDGRFVGRT